MPLGLLDFRFQQVGVETRFNLARRSGLNNGEDFFPQSLGGLPCLVELAFGNLQCA